MSKERELLKRVRDTLRGLEETHYDLYWDIQAELEKIEQKPINVGYLCKQEDCYGDIQTVFKVDKPYIRWHNVTDVTPVYLAPPKREPLSEDKLDVLAEANISDEAIAGYYLGFRDAEKHHGIEIGRAHV